jgi:hypothetical protein
MTRIGEDRKWESIFQTCYVEWMRFSPTRHVCEFFTSIPVVDALERLSRHWPKTTLLLDYDDERNRVKGVAKAKAGQTEHYQFRY